MNIKYNLKRVPLSESDSFAKKKSIYNITKKINTKIK